MKILIALAAALLLFAAPAMPQDGTAAEELAWSIRVVDSTGLEWRLHHETGTWLAGTPEEWQTWAAENGPQPVFTMTWRTSDGRIITVNGYDEGSPEKTQARFKANVIFAARLWGISPDQTGLVPPPPAGGGGTGGGDGGSAGGSTGNGGGVG